MRIRYIGIIFKFNVENNLKGPRRPVSLAQESSRIEIQGGERASVLLVVLPDYIVLTPYQNVAGVRYRFLNNLDIKYKIAFAEICIREKLN